MVKKIIIPLLFLIAVITLDACKSSTSSDAAAMASKGMIPIDAITFKTGNGWGYSILVDNKVYIRQAVIPAVEGDAGFSSDEDAVKVARLVIDKIKKHEKPTIKKAELYQMGIIK